MSQLKTWERREYSRLSGWTLHGITDVLIEKPEKEITKTEEKEAL